MIRIFFPLRGHVKKKKKKFVNFCFSLQLDLVKSWLVVTLLSKFTNHYIY
jgi:hypothetical protein